LVICELPARNGDCGGFLRLAFRKAIHLEDVVENSAAGEGSFSLTNDSSKKEKLLLEEAIIWGGMRDRGEAKAEITLIKLFVPASCSFPPQVVRLCPGLPTDSLSDGLALVTGGLPVA
jgi:hypothetical protein